MWSAETRSADAACWHRHNRQARFGRCTHRTPPPLRTKWTRRVPHPVLIGHAASLTPYAATRQPWLPSCGRAHRTSCGSSGGPALPRCSRPVRTAPSPVSATTLEPFAERTRRAASPNNPTSARLHSRGLALPSDFCPGTRSRPSGSGPCIARAFRCCFSSTSATDTSIFRLPLPAGARGE